MVKFLEELVTAQISPKISPSHLISISPQLPRIFLSISLLNLNSFLYCVLFFILPSSSTSSTFSTSSSAPISSDESSGTTVFVDNCNVILRAIMEKCGDVDDCISTTEAAELAAKHDENQKSTLPLPGQVDFINGGSPCQGFPDSYELLGRIRNAVPPPLAFALGRKLKEALYLKSSLLNQS